MRSAVVTRDSEERYYVASQWNLIWRNFKKHKLGLAAFPVLGCLYFLAVFGEFISAYTPVTYFRERENVAPQRIHFVRPDGTFQLRPFV